MDDEISRMSCIAKIESVINEALDENEIQNISCAIQVGEEEEVNYQNIG